MRLLLMSIIGVFLIGCQLQADESGRAVLIEEEVQKRVLSLVDTRHKRCLNELYEKANAVVDSILIEMAKAEKNDIVKPPKPSKPIAPELVPLKDTIPVSPFLPKSLNR